jgi:hypothetical protein
MKMKNTIKLISFLAVLAFFASSCNPDEEPEIEQTYGSITIETEHVWAMSMEPFVLNKQFYHPMTEDSLTYTTFKYYVSNVELKNANGTWWKAPESYFLIDLENDEDIQIDNIPSGDYTAIRFLYGVDSARNVSGAQDGALSTANGMFWSWNTGYIMIKAEGTSPDSKDGDFAFHLGGFTGEFAVPLQREFEFGETVATINPEVKPVVHFMANPARLFHSAGSVSDKSKTHMPGETAAQMSRDFYTWTRLDHVHN